MSPPPVGVVGWPLRIAHVHPRVIAWLPYVRVCWAITMPGPVTGMPWTLILGLPPRGLN